jgi:DNA-binding beta-propeller fold protein YncE
MNSMRTALITALAGTAVLSVLAASAGSARSWVDKSKGRPSGDDPWALAVSPDGTKVVVTGRSGGAQEPPSDYATVAYDASSGETQWVSRYDGRFEGDDEAYAVAFSRDGKTVYVTGTSYGGRKTRDDYATIAYRVTTGAKLWVARYNGPASRGDYALSIVVSRDGKRVFVTGGSRGGDYLDATVAYDARTGKRLWVARSEMGGSVAASADGRQVFVTGEDFNTVAYDTATGAKLWIGRYEGPGEDFGDFDETTVVASGDGTKVFVSGTSEGIGTFLDYATVAYDASTGARLWVSRYDGPSGDEELGDFATSQAVSSDGTKVFVTGSDEGPEGPLNYATVAYDATTGVQLWVARGPVGSGESITASGTKVFVTGVADDGAFGTVAYDSATGAKLWTARPGTESRGDWGRAVGLSGDGKRLFVTGLSELPTTYIDYATIAYDAATGTQAWVARYNGPSKDCVVPNVRGLLLPAAQTKIRRANCALGTVERAPSRMKPGRVLAQRPKPGAVLDFKWQVDLVVSRGQK